MKRLLQPLFLLLLLVFSCTRVNISQQEPLLSSERSYKISLDSLKRQAVSLNSIFGTTATKSRAVSVKNVISISSILGSRSASKSEVDDSDVPKAYVINFASGAGFAILADDKRLPNNIFAYSNSGNINAMIDNPGVLLFLEQTEHYLADALQRVIIAPYYPANYTPNKLVRPSNWGVTSPAMAGWSYYFNKPVKIHEVAPLLSVKWGQNDPYDLLTPTVNGQHCPTGCVATAIVQIMSYYQWPQSVNVNNQNWSINWSAALNKDIVAGNIHYLMRAVGNGVGMSYAINGSGAPSSNVPGLFRSYKYTSSDVSSFSKYNATDEIDQNRPVYVDGFTKDGQTGHAWVVDGYYKLRDDGYQVVDYVDDSDFEHPKQIGQSIKPITRTDVYLYCNWGWDDAHNGYYNAFIIDETNYKDKYNYNYNNHIIYNIKH